MFSKFGALGAIRTPNLLIRSQIGLSDVLTREIPGRPKTKRAKLDAVDRDHRRGGQNAVAHCLPGSGSCRLGWNVGQELGDVGAGVGGGLVAVHGLAMGAHAPDELGPGLLRQALLG